MTLNFLIVLWIENTSFWSFIINLRLFYYDLLVASSFYCSLLWFWCECEPRSAGWSVFSCCSCLLFYRLTHGSCDGPHLRVAPSCPENYLQHHEACICQQTVLSHVSHCTALAPAHFIVRSCAVVCGGSAPASHVSCLLLRNQKNHFLILIMTKILLIFAIFKMFNLIHCPSCSYA